MHLLLVIVVVTVGVEVVGHRLHDLARHFQLGGLDLDLLVQHREIGVPDLVGPQQRLDDHHIALAEILNPQRREPGLVAQRKMHDGDAIGLLERLGQQHIRFGRLALGFEEVTLVVHHRVDVAGRDELQDLDLPAAFFGQGGYVFVGDDHHLAVIGFVRPRDVAVFDDLAAYLAGPLVADAPVVLLVHLVELDVMVLGRAVHLDRDVHQAESD